MSADTEKFRAILKEKGLKVTNQRVMILAVLAGSPDKHLTAEEIYETVKAEYPEIGLATVYRTIQLLLELKLIDRINLDDGFVRYEIGHTAEDERHHHHHLICRKCGQVYSFEDDLLELLEKRIEETTGFLVKDHEVKMFGYCKQCSEKKNERKNKITWRCNLFEKCKQLKIENHSFRWIRADRNEHYCL